MTNIKLSKRLQTIANMIDKNSSTIDIGCDHALLDIYLVSNNIVKKAIASDITEGALNQAKNNIKLYDIDNLELRLANGLDALNNNDGIDTIIISGLGNQTIVKILKDNINKLTNTLIIQSNTGYYDLRKNICNLGYHINDEVIIKENGIKYIIIKFVKGAIKYSNKELFFGPILLNKKDKLFIEYMSDILDKNNKIIDTLPNKYIFKKIRLKIINNMIKREIQ